MQTLRLSIGLPKLEHGWTEFVVVLFQEFQFHSVPTSCDLVDGGNAHDSETDPNGIHLHGMWCGILTDTSIKIHCQHRTLGNHHVGNQSNECGRQPNRSHCVFFVVENTHWDVRMRRDSDTWTPSNVAECSGGIHPMNPNAVAACHLLVTEAPVAPQKTPNPRCFSVHDTHRNVRPRYPHPPKIGGDTCSIPLSGRFQMVSHRNALYGYRMSCFRQCGVPIPFAFRLHEAMRLRQGTI